MDVTEVKLPGVGLRYEFDLAQGGRIGVVARRSGDFEFMLYGPTIQTRPGRSSG